MKLNAQEFHFDNSKSLTSADNKSDLSLRSVKNEF